MDKGEAVVKRRIHRAQRGGLELASPPSSAAIGSEVVVPELVEQKVLWQWRLDVASNEKQCLYEQKSLICECQL